MATAAPLVTVNANEEFSTEAFVSAVPALVSTFGLTPVPAAAVKVKEAPPALTVVELPVVSALPADSAPADDGESCSLTFGADPP